MTVPFLKVISRLIERGVEVRLIHAKEPGPNFRKDFDDYSILAKRLERVLCPRVHFKMVIFDLETAYVGSANLTGAGLGMKGERNRNFEAGVLTNAPSFVEQAINQFDFVWNGSQCKKCGRKRFCPDSPLKYFAFSDSHGMHRRLYIPETADILLCAGDVVSSFGKDGMENFFSWLLSHPARLYIFVAGNHELFLEDTPEIAESLLPKKVVFLHDSTYEFDGIKFGK